MEYIINKKKELKVQQKQYDEAQARKVQQARDKIEGERDVALSNFALNQDSVTNVVKRKASAEEEKGLYMQSRKKLIDDTDKTVLLEQLNQISPWLPIFTPSAEADDLMAPPVRPTSPMSGAPLRAADLM